jgi:hypothetical protein
LSETEQDKPAVVEKVIATWGGVAAADVPGFAKSGEKAHLDTMTIFVIHGGQIHEWSDVG